MVTYLYRNLLAIVYEKAVKGMDGHNLKNDRVKALVCVCLCGNTGCQYLANINNQRSFVPILRLRLGME